MQGSRRDALYNFISIVMLGFTVLAVIVMALIFTNPNAGFNPFPPGQAGASEPLPTLYTPEVAGPPEEQLPTLPPSWTPSPSPTGGPTATPSPTPTITNTPTATTTKVFTPTHTLTPTPTGPTDTPTPTESPYPYVLQSGTPRYTQYFGGPNPNTLCDWAGLAGQVLDSNGIGIVGERVHVFGSGIDEYSTSGSYASTYGSGGWEVNVHIMPVIRTFTVRIENASGQPLSEDVQVTTSDSCASNLVIVNFVAVQ